MKNELKRSFKIFLFFSRSSLKTILQGRLGVVFFLAGKVFRFAFIFSLILLVFSKTRLIRGYSLNQAIIFYLTYNIIDTTAQIFFREVYRFRPLVVSGNFDLVLTKPFHPFLKVLVGGIDFLDLTLLIPYFILTLILTVKTIGFNPGFILIYLVLIFNSVLIACGFHIIVLALAILTANVDHTIMIYRDITSLGRFPMEIYKEPIRGFFTFIVPIGVMMSYPAKALFNLLSVWGIVFSFAVAVVLLIVSVGLWNLALKKYQSWGG